MRLLWSLLVAALVAFPLGCGGPESSYQDRPAPEGEVAPEEAMQQMQQAAQQGQGEQATPAESQNP